MSNITDEVSSCDGCTFHRYVFYGDELVCNHPEVGEKPAPYGEVPTWCPLRKESTTITVTLAI